ncbi:L,D-transpeptidase family protein [Herminiimonas aquatilis]|uniref:L,D-transpeptidase family protein n=1 Tax=Herminiimonas aquatilis TaxID=345342 RepID=A0ABW2J702_9BURK
MLTIVYAHAAVPGKESKLHLPVSSQHTSPDSLLNQIYQAMAANNLRAAEEKADALVAAFPNFRLGHLIRGDLLLMHTRPVAALGAAYAQENEKLQELRAEARARLHSIRKRPDPTLIPRALLMLRGDQKHVLVADTKRSRLYVYENQGGQPKLLADYYVSQGKLGIDKLKEGDRKTPLGVYYITARIPSSRLPDFYGSGALPINYPNEWDKRTGRGGSGIWLHGTPTDTFSRPPLASEGCLVLTNPDLQALYKLVDINNTPVVISSQVEFVTKETWSKERRHAAQFFEGWRRDFESRDLKNLLTHYSSQFTSANGTRIASELGKQMATLQGKKNMSISLQDMSIFYYPGFSDMIVGTFTTVVKVGSRKDTTRLRQFWIKDKGRWTILHELRL